MKKLALILILTILLAGCSQIDDQSGKASGQPTQNAGSTSGTSNDKKVPAGVTEKEITIGKKGWELPGILTVPEGDDKFPVVILVHGSGPNDRDETIGPNKPFRDIAWGLAQKGIASIRYDKRTYVYGKKMALDPSLTVYEETIEDALLAESFVSSNSSFVSEGTYILGHSLGGMLIPRIAKKSHASGFIILSGPVLPLEDHMVEQVKYLSSLDGTVSKDEENAIKTYEIMRDNVKKVSAGSTMSTIQLFNIPPAYWLDLKDYNPAELAKEITSPLLILQGERDYQVTMTDFSLWKEALAGKENVTLKSYTGLDHILLNGTEKSSPQEYSVPGQVDQRVIDDINTWIADTSNKK